MDSASWNLVFDIMQKVPSIIFIFTSRPVVPLPDSYQSLMQKRNIVNIKLRPLNETELRELIATRLEVSKSDVPAEIFSVITSKSQGNPLFAEEMIKVLLETGTVQVVNGKCKCETFPTNIFPDSMQGVITNRIDRLPAVQQVRYFVFSHTLCR